MPNIEAWFIIQRSYVSNTLDMLYIAELPRSGSGGGMGCLPTFSVLSE